MRLQISSDWHLTFGLAEDFTGPDEAFIALLDQWIEEGDAIIALGDIVDLWQAKWRGIFRAHGPLLLKLIRHAKWIIGNHDEDVRFWLEAHKELVIGGVYVCHGSHLDPVLQRIPRLARLASRAVGWLERRVHPDVDVWAQAAFQWMTRTGRHGSNMRYAKALVKETKEKYGDTVHTIVFGHTHKRWEALVGGIRVINCGCNVNGKSNSVTIET